MKKLIIIVLILLVSGCKKDLELKCVKTSYEESYDTKTIETFNFDGDELKKSQTNYIMTFISENEANTYFSMFNSLDESYNVMKNSNTEIEIIISNDVEVSETKKQVIERLEKDGYFCE